MSKEEVVLLGFEPLGFPNLLDAHLYPLGRMRFLSFNCIGTPNEMLWITQKSRTLNEYTDLVCLRNFDYDGAVTKEELTQLISVLK